MKTSQIIMVVAAIALVLSFNAGMAQAGDHPEHPTEPPAEVAAVEAAEATPAPDFTLEDQNGNEVKLADYKGKIVVLEWTNPNCPVVKRHYKAGTMIDLAKEYGEKDVIWLAINSSHDLGNDKNAEWVAAQEIPYPVLNDQSGEVGAAYSAKTTPHMFIIDAEGNIAYQGAIDNNPHGKLEEGVVNYVAQALDELLAAKPVSLSESKAYGCSVKYAEEEKAAK